MWNHLKLFFAFPSMLLKLFVEFYRWALYPPGRVPVGVTVHVIEEDGDVNVDTPSSLQVFKHKPRVSTKLLAVLCI